MGTITSLLVANRGEIARRICQTCREMGIISYVLYQAGEENYPHVKEADRALFLGEGGLQETYLNQEKILAFMREFKIEALHPGYGFLSENPTFRKRCDEAGFLFIGPKAKSMEIMGDKKTSKDHLKKFNIPLIPGYSGDNQDPLVLAKEADKISYPILIKATAGGGGKGMKVVEEAKHFQEALESAKREAFNAFSNDNVLLEKFIISPRHIEVQVFGDQFGDVIHMFERDCSLQRRHQKVIEEAPAPRLTSKTREGLYQAAIAIAQSVDYINAGTLEFIVDEKENFYFLEMNTRLQVEHPVSEMITNQDFVKLQIQIAEGKKLKDLMTLNNSWGHSLEARLYAENPYENFLPTVGKFQASFARFPHGIRLDFGYESGDEVGTAFDPMLGKIISFGKDREEARQRLVRFLEHWKIEGIQTNKEFIIQMLNSDDFKQARLHTQYLDEAPELLVQKEVDDDLIPLLVALWEEDKTKNETASDKNSEGFEFSLPGWRLLS